MEKTMNGFIKRTVTACVTGAVTLAGGCYYRDLVDPCYPERYEYAARQEILAAHAPQVSNGHVLDQTVWNYQFEPGKDKLTPGGIEHLAYLARRRPCPDPTVYVQTSQDLIYDQAAPERFAQDRTALDARRVKAVKDYLTAATAGRNVDFQVCVHDPSEVGMAAVPVLTSIGGTLQPPIPPGIPTMNGTPRGTLPAAAGAGAVSTVGGAGTSR
jgi:hypothetical protein